MPKLDNFTTMSETNLHQFIMEMPKKSCEIDTIPTELLKKVLKHCMPTLTKLINLSLNTEKYHNGWKSAVI